MEKHSYYVYILASRKNGTLYIGVTNDLERRVEEHKTNIIEGFTKKYRIYNLVYYEKYDFIYDAICREKCIKEWQRKWKIELIEKVNPKWKDLSEEW
ncbi:MAG: GIY-YIG nuclease family protein [Minisyncoccia bacterium]